MKLRITFDIDERDRLLFGAKIHGTMTPATRDEIISIITLSVDDMLVHDREVFDEYTKEVIKQLGIKGK